MFVGIPQALHVRKVGHGEGVSLLSWILLFAVSCSWSAYGATIGAPSVLVTNLGAGIVNGSVVYVLITRRIKALSLLISIFASIWILVFVVPDVIVQALLIIVVFAQSPQIFESLRNYRNKKATVVSMPALRTAAFAMSCWGIYGIIAPEPVIFITTCIALSINIIIQILETLNARQLRQP